MRAHPPHPPMPATTARRSLTLVLLLALPWLWPFTLGPVAATAPYLAALATAATLLALWPAQARASQAADWLAHGWLVAALLSSAIGLLQYFNLEAPLFPWANIAQSGQAFGNLRQTNQLATLLMLGLAALAWLARSHRWHPAWTAAAALPLLVALAATASRTGLLQLAALGLLALAWARGGGRLRTALGITLATLLAYLLASLALPWLAHSWAGVDGRSVFARLGGDASDCSSRLVLWRNVLHLIALRPWLGWGWGELDYAHYITLYDGPRFCEILDNAHNLPLQLAVELGLPFALGACLLAGWLAWRSQPWRETDPCRQLAWAALLVIGLHSLLEYPLWYGPFQIAALLALGLLWATRPAATLPTGLTPLRQGFGVLLLAASAFAGWDYWRASQPYLAPQARAAAWRNDPFAAARQSLLFGDAVRFGEVTTRTPSPENADWMLATAARALHFSPEPRVITRLIEAATLLGRSDLAQFHTARFKAAFAQDWLHWSQGRAEVHGESGGARP